MMILARLLYRNMKGYRVLVLLAILVTISQVGCDLIAAMPLKFIPSKVNNPGSDPACSFPFLDPVLSLFDTPLLDPSLRPTAANQPVGTPPPAPCPATPSDPSSITNPRITAHSVIGVIVFSLLLLLVFGILSALLSYVELYLATFIAQHLSSRLREELFDHLQRLSLDWHDRQKKGDLVQRITGNIADIEKLVTDGLVDLLAGLLTLVGVATIMLFISVQYTVLSLIIAPLLFLLVFSYTGGIKRAARSKSKAAGKIADVATEDMNALAVIRAFTLENRENRRFGTYVQNHQAAGMQAGRLQAQFTPLVAVLVVIGTLLVVGVGGYVAAGNSVDLRVFTIPGSTLDVGTLILFLTYLKMLYQPMRDLSKLTNVASNASSGAERIQEVLDQAPEVIDTVEEYTGPERLKGSIRFENVQFNYLQDQPVLKGINLTIPAGHKVALVGYSGSGKTTLAKLIPRFYEIAQGSLNIDGVEVSKYPLPVLRQNISLVLQDSVLFEGTIRENIEIGHPGATMDQIIAAAIKANIHEMIARLPDGYDTVVREQGSNFSAGQRQRLAIARAILRDTPILILDEPTANLDVESEAEVMNALNSLITGRTVLTISHRLSTLGKVDEIIVMSEGRIVEQGTFKDLKKLGGVFTHLLDEQNRYNLDREDEETLVVRSVHVKTLPPAERVARKKAKVAAVSRADTGRDVAALLDVNDPILDVDTGEVTAVTPAITTITAKMTAHLPATPPPRTPLPAIIKTPPTEEEFNAQMTDRKPAVRIHVDGKMVKEYLLDKPSLVIGRYSKSDIQIASPRVSRRHATLYRSDGVWIIEDAESLNGLTWRGYRISQMALSNGDRIYLDPTIVLQYVEEEEESASSSSHEV
jgi:ABC-type multidrug transport system fused ATPase/permease subunit